MKFFKKLISFFRKQKPKSMPEKMQEWYEEEWAEYHKHKRELMK